MSLRVVLATWGSYGDLHPYMAMAQALQRRGHQVLLCSSERYRAKVASAGISFSPLRPDLGPELERPEFLRRLLHTKHGTEVLLREVVLPSLGHMYSDLMEACEGADVLVGSSVTYAVSLVAEKLQLPWLSVALAPISLFSADDPPMLAPYPRLHSLRHLGSWPYRILFGLAEKRLTKWAQPVYELREKVGLPRPARSPLMHGTFSKHGNLVLFSPVLARPQRDWPEPFHVCGFAWYDEPDPVYGDDTSVQSFIQAGEAPLLFTLGTGVSQLAGDFFERSSEAARLLNRRAVFILGKDAARVRPLIRDPERECVAGYVTYSQVFPHALAVVHQGGIGTTGQALRAGRPQLVVPFGFDQPDNAYRVERIGCGLALPAERYTAGRASGLLGRLVGGSYAEKAALIAGEVSAEDGASEATRVLESLGRVRR